MFCHSPDPGEWRCVAETRKIGDGKMPTITLESGGRFLLNSEAVQTEILVISGYAMGSGRKLSDNAAATIASFWMAPGGHGKVFTQLATTGSVDSEELLAAVAYELSLPSTEDGWPRRELEYLAEWAKNHPSITAG